MAGEMLTAELSAGDLAELRSPRDFPAVSLIIPTHRTFPDRKTDPILLRNLLDEAAVRLRGENLPRGIADEVTGGLNLAATAVDLNHSAEAIALFAAPGNEHYSFTLPYVHPAPRVAIGLSFATRDLVSAREHVWDYWVLALSEQPARLWSGAGELLSESNAGGFPMAYSNGQPAERSAIPRPRRAERGKDDKREQFFRHVLGEMAAVLARDSRPLVVTGVKRYLAYFSQLAPAAVQSQFIGFVEGSFDQATGPELVGWVAPVLTAERERWQRAAIGRLEVARSERLLASGLAQVWDLAAAGQVRELLAEEGYLAPAHESDGHLLPRGDPGGACVDDAVEVIMDGVLNGGGEVIFVPDGALEPYGRIAASLRY